ncbi:putative chaperone DnaJ [Rosa chinensis]|uniref:Putative chaperone DnaJ n=2 Tax=Rosa chinensis TaxID=74649 RepID=A0A2P6PXH1_ROSCH|nr:putative chaperone DnaJ [Rosa chinensis]
MRSGVASGIASIQNLYRAAYRSITRKWHKYKKKPASDEEPKADEVHKVIDNNVPVEGEGKDGLIQDEKSMNGFQYQSFRFNSPGMRGNDSGSARSSSSFFKHSSVDGLFNMSCHNLTRCGTRSASHTPSRSHHKRKTRKSCPTSPETSNSSGRKSSTDSTSTTPLSRSAPLSKSGPLSNCESRRSTTIMFSQSSGMLKPPAIEKQLECTLEELCFGCNKKMKVTRVVVKDTGQMAQEEELVTINVKPGWKKGTKITFEGLGNERPGAYPADIIFVIAEKRHHLFVREGDDLELTVEIPLIQALTGCTISIPLLGGENTTLTIEDIIYPGYEKTIPDQGMPISKVEGKRGNLKVTFLVEFPTSLTHEQRSDVHTILEEC